MSEEIRELVGRSLTGDQFAARDLVDRFRGQVFGLCFRILRHRQDAEDMTQEAFARALRNLQRWDPTRDFRPWLLAIAGNRCRTLLSTRKKHQPGAIDVALLADVRPAKHGDPYLLEEITRALGELRSEYRDAFLLFHRDELSYTEIAETLGCPVGTVKTWIHRARRELAELLYRRGAVEEREYAMRRR